MELNRFVGCMLGGAYGDSLGAAIEFLTWEEIAQQFGGGGVTQLLPAYDQPAGVITDDTQLAIATAEGLVAAENGQESLATVWRDYCRWYEVQLEDPSQRRAPGATTLQALATQKPGTLPHPPNRGRTCGAVMRMHPVGLAMAGQPEAAFNLGIRLGVLTHGHPDGFMPAGFLAALISDLVVGRNFEQSVAAAWRALHGQQPGAITGTVLAIKQAMTVTATYNVELTSLRIDQVVGRNSHPPGGWCGDDALAIAIYAVRCGLAADDPLYAVQVAVNHSGDSDSTGAIAGAIIGAIYGDQPFNQALIAQSVWIEHRDKLTELALALYNKVTNGHSVDASSSA